MNEHLAEIVCIVLAGVFSFIGGYGFARFHQGEAKRFADRCTDRIFGKGGEK